MANAVNGTEERLDALAVQVEALIACATASAKLQSAVLDELNKITALHARTNDLTANLVRVQEVAVLPKKKGGA